MAQKKRCWDFLLPRYKPEEVTKRFVSAIYLTLRGQV